MFQFSDDIDDDVLEDVLSISTNQAVSERKKKNESNVLDCSTSVVETEATGNNSRIALQDCDDDLILSAFDDDSFYENDSTFDSAVVKCSGGQSTPVIHTSQVAQSSKTSDYVPTPIVAKHKSSSSCDSPNSAKYSKVEYERKFPGPAGLIPKKSKDISVVFGEKLVPSTNLQFEHHQTGDSLFDSSLSWQALFNDVNSKSNKLLQTVNEFTINNVKRLNLVKHTSWKIPAFAAIINNLDSSVHDPSVTLKDPSGEIRGTLHKDLWEQYNHLLLAGSALLLRQVSVMSLINSRKLYLNITMNNIVSIYTSPRDDESLTITHVTMISEDDLNEIKAEGNAKSFNSPGSKVTAIITSHSGAKARSNADLLNLIKNSNTSNSSNVCSPLKVPSVKNSILDLDSNSLATNNSVVNVTTMKISHSTTSNEETNASLILSELEGLDADSLFDDF